MTKKFSVFICLAALTFGAAADEKPTSVRVKFMTPEEFPPGHVQRSATWTDFRPMFDRKSPNLTVLASAGIDGRFPVKRDGRKLFEVVVTDGDDSALKVEIRRDKEDPIPLELDRDDIVQFSVDGSNFGIRFATVLVSSEEAESAFTSDKATLILMTPKEIGAELVLKTKNIDDE